MAVGQRGARLRGNGYCQHRTEVAHLEIDILLAGIHLAVGHHIVVLADESFFV